MIVAGTSGLAIFGVSGQQPTQLLYNWYCLYYRGYWCNRQVLRIKEIGNIDSIFRKKFRNNKKGATE